MALLLALLVFVPGWVASVRHKHEASKLIDRVDAQRAEVLTRTEQAGAVLEVLGAPVRSWSAVRCSLDPRLSDGDGEVGVVVYYHQTCAPVVFEVYALPAENRTLEQAATLLGGRVGDWSHGCNEPILDVPGPDLDQIESGYSMDLSWIEPTSTDGDDDCSLPEPSEANTTRVRVTVDEPLTASSYVVFVVRGQREQVNVGCERDLGWLGTCRAEPEGAPYL